jgi:hypothetical protein
LPKQTPHKHGRGFANGMTFDKTSGGCAAFLAFLTPIMAQCLRVLKPGGYALVWALPRTSHWTATALEDAGFEIRDVVVHITGQGFPKGQGCLKPAAEHWILCRRPGPRVLPLNIEECRIKGVPPSVPQPLFGSETGRTYGMKTGEGRNGEMSTAAGRYPANLVLSHHESCVCRGTKRVRGSNGVRGASTHIYGGGNGFTAATGEEVGYAGPDGTEEVEDWACHPECPVFLLDSQAGDCPSKDGAACGGFREGPSPKGFLSNSRGMLPPGRGDTGGPSRFFYCAKADRADRGEGNDHPTTKSTSLMRWLVTLISRPGETVLDPFCGSGSTGVAALRCERRFVGVERDAHYHAIALKRLAAVDGPLFARPAGEAAP